MHVSSLKMAAAIAKDHGQGVFVVLHGIEWSLVTLSVVDKPEGLALCEGHTLQGDLVVFNAEDVELVRIPVAPDGRRARLAKLRGE